jgi:hypothetical protein
MATQLPVEYCRQSIRTVQKKIQDFYLIFTSRTNIVFSIVLFGHNLY